MNHPPPHPFPAFYNIGYSNHSPSLVNHKKMDHFSLFTEGINEESRCFSIMGRRLDRGLNGRTAEGAKTLLAESRQEL